MARYRQVETAFWTDSFVLKLTPEEKYYYLFLLTNPHTTQCGIYELPEMMAQVETGYNRETLIKLRDRFVNRYKKIAYSEQTEEYCIVNWLKYNSLKSPKVKSCIEKEIADVKDKSLIQYLYGIESLSIDWGEEEEEEKEEEEKEEEEREEKKKEKKTPKIIKHKHGLYNNVSLSDTEYSKLINDYGYNQAHDAIEFLSAYREEKGYKNKSDYLSIKRWVFDAVNERKLKSGNPFKDALRRELENEQERSNSNYDGYQGGLSELLPEPDGD